MVEANAEQLGNTLRTARGIEEQVAEGGGRPDISTAISPQTGEGSGRVAISASLHRLAAELGMITSTMRKGWLRREHTTRHGRGKAAHALSGEPLTEMRSSSCPT